jgi:hypothetical protein
VAQDALEQYHLDTRLLGKLIRGEARIPSISEVLEQLDIDGKFAVC